MKMTFWAVVRWLAYICLVYSMTSCSLAAVPDDVTNEAGPRAPTHNLYRSTNSHAH